MKTASRKSGFTLIEMLVVIVILGILAGLAVPALKNISKSDANASAARQLLDDVGRARQMAISRHTTVYMVFVSTNFWLPPFTANSGWTNSLTPAQFSLAVNLVDKQLTGYTFVSYGNVGDQPGQHQWNYLEEWKYLPDGTFISAQKFSGTNLIASYPISEFHYTNNIPFPTWSNSTSINPVSLPYIAFNYLGQLTFDGLTVADGDEYIPLARGNVSFGYDASTKSPELTAVSSGDVTETPPGNSTGISYNIVHIDALTGRAVLEFYKLK